MSEQRESNSKSERGTVHRTITAVAIFALVAGLTAWWFVRGAHGGRETGSQSSTGEATTYYCPMHPTYTSDRPGDCPICNMKLVPLKAGGSGSQSRVEGRAAIRLEDHRRQLIGVRTGVVSRKSVEQSIRAVGRVEYDEARRTSVNLRVSGWVESLFVKTTGEKVQAGEALFSLYSPELIEAQRNYLLALRRAQPHEAAEGLPDSSASGDLALRATRERLLLLGQAEDQIRELEAAGEVPQTSVIRARSSGIVVRKDLLEGGRVEAGMDVLEIADTSRVWVLADIYEYEVPLVHPGQGAFIQLSSMPGEAMQGQVTYVYPYLDPDSRTARTRIEVPNPEGRLMPGMFATVFLTAPLGEQLVIEAQAVLDTGDRKLVFLDHGEGRLEPREIETGSRAGDEVVVLEGLEEGDRVVTSGNFLVDSESRLQAALSGGMRAASPDHAEHGK